jgi:hypothetical protein
MATSDIDFIRSHFRHGSVQKLSPTQIRNLFHGKPVRVKEGNHHKLILTNEQHHAISKAHKKGMATTIKFSEFQRKMHSHEGGGIFDTLKNIGHQAMPVLGELGKEAAKAAIPIAAKYAEKKILGDGLRHRKKKHGDGFFDDVKNSIMPVAKEITKIAAPIAIEYGKKQLLGGGMHTHCMHCGGSLTGGALNPAGYGVHHEHHRKRGRPKKHGAGIGNDILSGLETGAKIAAPLLPFLL